MSNGAGQPQVSTFALLAGAAAAVAASAAAAGASAAISRLPKPRLASQAWRSLLDDEGRITDQHRFAALCKQGVDPDIRQSVWPLLLGVYPLSSSDAERQLLRSELDKSFRGLLTEAQGASASSRAQGDNGKPNGNDASLTVNGNVSAGHDGSSGVNGSSSTTFAETQRCITMDVLRTDFDSLVSSGLSGVSPAAATPPDADGAACAVECISAAAQDVLNEAQYLTPHARRQAVRLFNLLCIYAVHDPQLGYAQGMSDLAAVFLAVFPDDDAAAFWCFERFMHAGREGFRHDECGIRRQLRQLSVLLSRADPVLHQRLKALQCADCLFAYRMVVVLLLRDLPTAQAVRLWECSWATQCLPTPNTVGLLQAFVLAVICGERRHVLQQCTASDDVICHFATLHIGFEPALREARRLQQEL